MSWLETSSQIGVGLSYQRSFQPISTANRRSHPKKGLNGGFNGKIIYKWTIFHGYVSHNQRVVYPTGVVKCPMTWVLIGHHLK